MVCGLLSVGRWWVTAMSTTPSRAATGPVVAMVGTPGAGWAANEPSARRGRSCWASAAAGVAKSRELSCWVGAGSPGLLQPVRAAAASAAAVRSEAAGVRVECRIETRYLWGRVRGVTPVLAGRSPRVRGTEMPLRGWQGRLIEGSPRWLTATSGN